MSMNPEMPSRGMTVRRWIQILRIAYRALTSLVIVVLLAVCAVMIIPRFFGLHAYAVMTGSMSPAISVGSIVFVEKVKFDDIAVGDIATFQSRKDPAKRFTHRVININTVDRTFTTQGDASDVPDFAPAAEQNLLGKVRHHIPLAGLPVYWMSGIYARLGAVLIIILWISVEIEIKLHAGKRRKTVLSDEGKTDV